MKKRLYAFSPKLGFFLCLIGEFLKAKLFFLFFENPKLVSDEVPEHHADGGEGGGD